MVNEIADAHADGSEISRKLVTEIIEALLGLSSGQSDAVADLDVEK